MFLKTALDKTFHSLRQVRNVTRADEESRVPGACPQLLEREFCLGHGTRETHFRSCL